MACQPRPRTSDGHRRQGASVNRIADAMGVSKPSLDAAFGAKELTVLAGLSVRSKGHQCAEALRAVIATAMQAWPATVMARGGSRRSS